MWSRYILKRRVDKYQQDTRSLLQQHRQSLAYREVRTVKIDCSFLPDSRWGILRRDPAWLLYLDVKISQLKDCSLTSANINVIFQSHNTDCQSNMAMTQLGPIITEYFGPQRINGEVINTHGRMVSQKSESSEYEPVWTLQGFSWPLAEDTSGLPRRVEWSVEDPVACGSLRLAVVLQHDMKPFSIAVHIDGRLKGENNKKFRLFHPIEQSKMKNLSCIVTPSGTHELQLDDIASQLDYEMTTLNIRNYRSATRMPPQQKEPVFHQAHLFPEPRNRINMSHSDTGQQPSVRNRHSHDDYTVAWICALPIEMAAATMMLEERHPGLSIHPGDTNQYVLGRIGAHDIVLTCLPNGGYGTSSAAVVATHMHYTFNRIRLRLLVGIGGGVPSATNDIRLGDVVISSPTGGYGGVIQHDFGKNIGHKIQMTGALNKPPQSLLVAIARLRMEHLIAQGNKISHYVQEMLTNNPPVVSNFAPPDPSYDQLFEPDYDHVGPAGTCNKCDQTREVKRPPRKTSDPKIHYGLIASGNQVMRHGLTRDRLALGMNILCFEMEAAGLMDNFPCLVVRGICDYADSHKSKDWQGYAAATAAGYAKDLLSVISVAQIYSIPIAGSS